MAYVNELMAYGVPAQVAGLLAFDTITDISGKTCSPEAGLTATGTTIADALPITYLYNLFTTVASGTGCKLPLYGSEGIGVPILIKNVGANALTIYPNNTAQGFARGTKNGTGISLAAGASATVRMTSLTNWES